MSTGGWIFMFGSILFVVSLCVFCFMKILTRPAGPDKLHAPQTINTHDKDT
ncbi:MAG: hypothetical protein ACUVYA_16450 [Planctomycetota bacterium]